jgi:biotin carboxyl carrier protein
MKREFSLTLDGTTYKIVLDGNSVLANGQPFVVGLEGERVLVDGTLYDVQLEGKQVVVGGIAYSLEVAGLEDARAPTKVSTATPAGEGPVTAIMPGKIIRVLASEGDEVAEGDVICILEAMRMANELKAPRDGTVRNLRAQPGQDVEIGALLAEID